MNEDASATWLSLGFWSEIFERTLQWALTAVPKVLIVLVLAIVLLRIVNFATARMEARAVQEGDTESGHDAREHHKRVGTLIGIVKTTATVAVWALAVVLVLTQVGINVAPIIAGAGILGLAVGFGAQELVRDVISGFFLLLENHVRNGDVAVINGVGGAVESMGLRTIVLRDLSGVVHVFQNGKIETLANMTKKWSAMVFDIEVAYKENTDEVVAVMLEVAETMRAEEQFANKILAPIDLFGLDSFGESGVVIKARFQTIPAEQWTVGREYRRRLKLAFDDRGIEIPVPHRTLYWGEASPPVELQGMNTGIGSSTQKAPSGRGPEHRTRPVGAGP